MYILPNMIGKIDKNDLMAILNDWNSWGKEFVTGVARPQYLPKLRRLMGSRQVVIVTGARRSGKSVLMRQAAGALAVDGISWENMLFVNLEDSRFPMLNVRLLDRLFETYLEFLKPQGEIYVFLDEIQEVQEWEKWVRSMHELRKAKMVVSGSNAHLLSRELGTLLTGRHLDLTVFPLSFQEFLAFNGVTAEGKLALIAKRIEIRSLLRKYLESGGFPEVALAEQKKEILLSYFEDLVHKDLVRRFRIRKPQELTALVKFYLSNTASMVTFSSIEKFLQISADTVEKFSGYLEQAYLVFFLKRFSFKVREQEKSPRKAYAIDTGLSNAVGFRFSDNLGRLAENVVFLELKRRQVMEPDFELFYWKDIQHREVDFVVKKGTKIYQLIQVCWTLTDHRTKERELRGLAKAMEEFKTNRAIIITEDEEGEEAVAGETIAVIPLWKWLLDPK
jgi:uncharacterized protein